MVDETAFRETYRDVNECACVFEKTILTRQGDCAMAERFCIAEREGVRCGDPAAQATCSAFLDWVREQARFALKETALSERLPHGRAIRIQVGGIRGLAEALQQPVPVQDIHGLLQAALVQAGDISRLPGTDIVRGVAAYRPKRRRRRRHPDRD